MNTAEDKADAIALLAQAREEDSIVLVVFSDQDRTSSKRIYASHLACMIALLEISMSLAGEEELPAFLRAIMLEHVETYKELAGMEPRLAFAPEGSVLN